MKLSILGSADDIGEEAWSNLETAGDPFASRGFLATAEACGAAGPDMAWHASHLALDADGALVGLMPLYRREHSFGDFSRDWNWPNAWRQAGLAYYPKLVTGIPYTPSPGPRLLVRHGIERSTVTRSLVGAAIELAREIGASNWQCLFVEDLDKSVLEAAGLMLRRGVQFHWLNQGYRDFDDFLSGFTSAKRKKLKRERRSVADSGLRIVVRHGDEIEATLWQTIHAHYRDTFLRYGNHPAFPAEFFPAAAARLGRQMVVFLAIRNGTAVASAICYRDGNTLYGRHWGTEIAQPGLHFELCYYQGIDYCLREGLQRFEPGAQGEHKLARGFEPVPTWSAYWIADPRMRDAVANFLAREGEAMQDYEAETEARLPFRQFGPRQST